MSGPDSNRFQKLLSFAIQNKASDIHLRTGEAPLFRIKNDLVSVRMQPLSETDLLALVRSAMGAKYKEADNQEIDFSFEFSRMARFRGNVFRQDGRLAVILRIIPFRVPTIDELGLPQILKQVAEADRGLALVTGATGSGKSTTLAAMIEHLNETKAIHIVTVEDPVEFVHQRIKAQITRREVGRDTISFSTALRSVLRQDPDVILIGELRDRESIDIALKAAETGHLVLSTAHTSSAPKTISKLVSMFPGEEQQAARRRLADNLIATVGQRLVKRKDGNGLVCVQEIMLNNASIHECISDGAKISEMMKYIEVGYGFNGSQSIDQHLLQLYRDGAISLQTAKENALNGDDFEKALVYNDSDHAPVRGDVGDVIAAGDDSNTSAGNGTISHVELDVREPEAPVQPKRQRRVSEDVKQSRVSEGILKLKKFVGSD